MADIEDGSGDKPGAVICPEEVSTDISVTHLIHGDGDAQSKPARLPVKILEKVKVFASENPSQVMEETLSRKTSEEELVAICGKDSAAQSQDGEQRKRKNKKRKAKQREPADDQESRPPKKPRPNYFISIQMTNKQVCKYSALYNH